MENKDFYLIHLDKEINVRRIAEKNGFIFIQRDDFSQISIDYISSKYYVYYLGKKIFNFKIITYTKNNATYVLKNNIRIMLSSIESIVEFVNLCQDNVMKLLDDFNIIKKHFYIGNNIEFYDEIPLKIPYLSSNWENTTIIVNIDDTYEVILNYLDRISLQTIQEVISSPFLESSRRTRFHNFLKIVKIF